MSLQPGAECNNSYDHTVGSTVYYVGNHNYAYIYKNIFTFNIKVKNM